VVGERGLVSLGLGAVAAGLTAGAAAGAVLERRLVRGPLRAPGAAPAALGARHTHPTVVRADDGVELYAEVDGPAPGVDPSRAPTVVLAHGYALNLDCWTFQRPALSQRCRVVLYDQRGHGRSGRGVAQRDTLAQLGADLAAVLDALAGPGPTVVVGHSMGGMALLAFAEAYPRRAAGLGAAALLATSAGQLSRDGLGVPGPVGRWARGVAPALMSQLARRPGAVTWARRTGSDLEFALTRAYSFASPVSPSLVDFVAAMNSATPLDLLGDFLPEFDRHDREAALVALAEVPTLVMVGAQDRLTPLEHSERLAAGLPGSVLEVLDPCGHMLQLERPQQVSAALERLLDRLPQPVAP